MRPINSMISREGVTLEYVPRVETVGVDGNPSYVYDMSQKRRITGLVWEAKGLTEEWETVGYRMDIDYVVILHSTYRGLVKPFDLILLEGGRKLFVDTVIERRKGRRVEFLELLCKEGE